VQFIVFYLLYCKRHPTAKNSVSLLKVSMDYSHSNTHDRCSCNKCKKKKVIIVKNTGGKIGPEGPQGKRGIRGRQGPQGIRGSGQRGPQGMKGRQGPRGLTGSTGAGIFPQPVVSDMGFTKGFGVRYRNFGNESGEQEIFLGIGDLGQPPPRRVEVDYNNWQPMFMGSTVTNPINFHFRLEYDTGTGKLTQEVQRVGGVPSSVMLPMETSATYPPVGTLSNALQNLQGVDIDTLNAIQFVIRNNPNPGSSIPGTVYTYQLLLKTASGSTYPLTSVVPEMPRVNIFQDSFELWPNDGTLPADGFSLWGIFTIFGEFPPLAVNQAEESKIEVLIVRI
jgi:hypothetical protein